MVAQDDQIKRITDGVKKYMNNNSDLIPYHVYTNEETFDHVANIGTNILLQKWEISPWAPGDFVRCITNNDLTGTFGRADSVNKKCIEFYVTLMYNLGYIE